MLQTKKKMIKNKNKPLSKVEMRKMSIVSVSRLSVLYSTDHFDIVTLGVDSRLFHCVAVEDGGYADCQ